MYGLDNLTDEEFFSVIHSNPEFAKEVIKIIIEVMVLLKTKECLENELKPLFNNYCDYPMGVTKDGYYK